MLNQSENSCGGEVENLSVQAIIDPLIIKYFPEKTQIMTSYLANIAFFHFITDVLQITAEVCMKWDPTSITLALIKSKIEDIQKRLNILLDADFIAAFERMNTAAIDLKYGNYASAFGNIEKVDDFTIRAFSQLKSFRKKAFCKMMNIYSTRMLASYDEDRKIFLDMFKLPEKKQQALAEKVFREVSKIVQEFENLEEPNWFQRKLNNAYKISEEQDYLDKLLKTALPIVWNQEGKLEEGRIFEDDS